MAWYGGRSLRCAPTTVVHSGGQLTQGYAHTHRHVSDLAVKSKWMPLYQCITRCVDIQHVRIGHHWALCIFNMMFSDIVLRCVSGLVVPTVKHLLSCNNLQNLCSIRSEKMTLWMSPTWVQHQIYNTQLSVGPGCIIWGDGFVISEI